MAAPRLWIVRHARPLVVQGICYGALDMAADAAATADAARALAQVLPPGIAAWHSPLQRCAQLAQALLTLRPDLAPHSDARLAELDFGAWEGRRWDAIAPADYDAWTARFAHYRPGGGESLDAMLQRVQAALRQAREAPGDTVWITHAGVARCVHWLITEPPGTLPGAAQWMAPAPAFGAWTTFDLDTD